MFYWSFGNKIYADPYYEPTQESLKAQFLYVLCSLYTLMIYSKTFRALFDFLLITD